MTLTINLTPQAEAWLTAEAQQQGLPPVELARLVIERRATVAAERRIARTPEERIRMLDTLAEKYADRPYITDSAFDRATIYEDSL